ncbi:hypothetical protein [Bacillus atrophaeus]|uniref:hypothetical protein n=1 Tax=Bacillus atrophaeus TaxID=1452 RepID=UPI0030F3DF33
MFRVSVSCCKGQIGVSADRVLRENGCRPGNDQIEIKIWKEEDNELYNVILEVDNIR